MRPTCLPSSRLLLIVALLAITCDAAPPPAPPVFPEPQQWKLGGFDFVLDDHVSIVVPASPSENDLTLARGLAGVLSERHGLGVPIRRTDEIPSGARVIVMGARSNPLVNRISPVRQPGIDNEVRSEGYSLTVDSGHVLVAGDDEAGAFHGFQSLRQLIRQDSTGSRIQGAEIRDWPYKPFRGVKLYLPGPDNIPFFKRFVRDFMALYKFNKLIIEVNACMRLERRPELNAGWIEFAEDLNFTRRDRPAGPGGTFTNSSHQDTADGMILEKREVAELVRWCNEHHIEVIPEIPSLSHTYYLLTRHRELAEIPDAEWPDTYCPLLPGSYDLLFDVLDEYIEVMQPGMVHVGHDEWRMPINVCERCRGKHMPGLFSEHLNRVHAYLANQNIRAAIWGDHLIEQLRGKGTHNLTIAGRTQTIPGGLSPDEVQRDIPKDILVFNWFWGSSEGAEETARLDEDARFGEMNDIRLERWGFEQVYGNFRPSIRDYDRRSRRRGIIGGVPSAWVGTTEFNFGKDVLADFLGCAPLLWSSRWMEPRQLALSVQAMMPEVRRNLSGRPSPRASGDPIRTLAVPASPGGHAWGRALVLNTPEPAAPVAIAVGEDATSIVFTHASAKPGIHEQGYRTIFNFADTAGLLGWYEVEYDDGFVETVPIRYAWNIREWNSTRACYAADPVMVADSSRFFAFEWVNPRLGIVVKEIRVRTSTGTTDLRGRAIPPNQLVLHGIEIVQKRTFPEPVKARAAPNAPL